jgi:hypothetical protein
MKVNFVDELMERFLKLGWKREEAEHVLTSMANRADEKGITVKEEYEQFCASIMISRIPEN